MGRSQRRQFLKDSLLGAAVAARPASSQQRVAASGQAAKSPGNRRVLVIGVGACRFTVVSDLVAKGRLPTFARLMREGVFADNVPNFHAQKTHTGWISIGTGATAGTHRILATIFSDNGLAPFRQHLIGGRCQAEFVWEAAERQGKDVILLAWPDSWPPRLKRGIQVAGACLGPNATFFEGEVSPPFRGPVHRFSLAADEFFSSEGIGGTSALVLQPTDGSRARAWGIDNGLEARLALRCLDADRPISEKPVLWMVIPPRTSGGGSDALLFKEDDTARPLASLSIGQWSPRLDIRIETPNGPQAAAFRAKLLSLDPAARQAKLYVTPLCALEDGRAQPSGTGRELASLKAFAIPTPVFLERYAAKLMDLGSQRELLEMSNRWHAEAARALLRRPFDLFMTFTNNIDWAQHSMHYAFSGGVRREACEEFVEACYEDLDRLIGDIIDAAPENTTVCVISEHGCIEPWHVERAPSVDQVLLENGLLVRDGSGQINLSKTRAYAATGFVNVLPWQPKTARERAAREENLREVLRVLSAAKVPTSNGRLCSVVLPWEDAGPFGFHGERSRDVLVYRPAQYGGIHGDSYPLQAGGRSSLKGMMVFQGPGVRSGIRESRPVHLEDFAPTVALLLGIDPPAHCEGRPLRNLMG